MPSIAFAARDVPAEGPAAGLSDAMVSTLAGDGTPGTRDGRASKAQFFAPFGVAAAPDGTIVIADAAGQRIRALAPNGMVSTLAGGGAAEVSQLDTRGGFADGSAAEARFDRPTGVAVGRDGAIYVADSLNHCIRRIADRRVTTYAGSAGAAGRSDGPRNFARFSFPRALSFDGEGNLYVADYGNGIRKIARDGTVSSYAMPNVAPATYTGIAAYGSGKSLTLYAADLLGLVVYRATTGAWTFVNATDGDATFGAPFSVAAVDARYAVFTDVRSQNVRIYRDGSPSERPYTRIIAGSDLELGTSGTGYRDGQAFTTRFFGPAGLALSGSRIIIADSGNRRLREASLPALREATAGVPLFSRHAYRIAFVSNAYTLGPELWDESLAAAMERHLQRTAAFPDGLHPEVRSIRLPIASTGSTLRFVRSALTRKNVDFVIVDINVLHVDGDIAEQPSLYAGDAWKARVAENTAAMASALRAAHTGFLTVMQPLPYDGSPGEAYFARATDLSPQVTYLTWTGHASQLAEALGSAHVPLLDLRPAMVAYEGLPGRRPVGSSDGDYFVVRGNRYIGEAIARELEGMRPWNDAAPAHGRKRSK